MAFQGRWRNQYGSILEIEDERDGRIVGRFKTALADSAFYGREIPVVGSCQGDCIGVAGGGHTPSGDVLVTYTGVLRDGRIETLWHVASDSALVASADGAPARLEKLSWWRTMMTGADSFERVGWIDHGSSVTVTNEPSRRGSRPVDVPKREPRRSG